MSGAATDITTRLLRWQHLHGRHDLPWQTSRDPYRVWLSEIMLQQTQVSTVLAYYPRFLSRFASQAALAEAELDEVLGLWSGLGYYSRARNLHRCAQEVRDRFGGAFPQTAAQLQTLPGIGRSTAAAIAAFCFGERAAILDGNVRRVLTRVLGFAGDMSQTAQVQALWLRAEDLLPHHDLMNTMPRYTQAVMDLGATICLSRKPLCEACPLTTHCAARLAGEATAYPVKTRKLKRSAQALWLLWAQNSAGEVWLERRPTPGVWAGLYCLPVYDSENAMLADLPAGHREKAQHLAPFNHVLTHKDLYLHPVQAVWATAQPRLGDGGAWFGPDQWPRLGLPAPVRRLLESGAAAEATKLAGLPSLSSSR